jgi:hypothetical protein
MHSFKLAPWLPVVPLLLFGAGCGKSTSPVSGRITVDGKPVATAMVYFIPENDSAPRHAFGMTDADGKFAMNSFAGDKSGVLPGSYKVTIAHSSNTVPPMGAPSGNEEDNARAMKDYRQRQEEMRKKPTAPGDLPAVYAEANSTPLRFKVPQDGQIANFDLSSSDTSAKP